MAYRYQFKISDAEQDPLELRAKKASSRRETLYWVVRQLVEQYNVTPQEIENNSNGKISFVCIGEETPTEANFKALLESGKDLKGQPINQTRRFSDPTRYTATNLPKGGAISWDGSNYLLYNQDSRTTIDGGENGEQREFIELSKSKGITWTREAETSIQEAFPATTNEHRMNPNLILYGPPGTGKTYNTAALADAILSGAINEDNFNLRDRLEKKWEKEEYDQIKDKVSSQIGNRVFFVTFHQSYTYEDFVGGLKPDADKEEGQLSFRWKPGVFLKACARAWELLEGIDSDNSANSANGNKDKKSEQDQQVSQFLKAISQKKQPDEKPYSETNSVVLIIDEINRANISRVFGELITLIEDDKRLGGENELRVALPNHPEGKLFSVPKNLYIVGTMNTADKSLALLDIALRRRFSFYRMDPQTKLVNDPHKKAFEIWNDNIEKLKKSRDYGIGHSFFMGESDLSRILINKVIPLLDEYFSGKKHLIQAALGVAKDESSREKCEKVPVEHRKTVVESLKEFNLYEEPSSKDRADEDTSPE